VIIEMFTIADILDVIGSAIGGFFGSS